MAGKTQDLQPLAQEKAMAALLALMVAEREDRLAAAQNGKAAAKHEARKTEVILAGAGLSPGQIVPLVGKNLEAVRKTIQRGKGK